MSCFDVLQRRTQFDSQLNSAICIECVDVRVDPPAVRLGITDHPIANFETNLSRVAHCGTERIDVRDVTGIGIGDRIRIIKPTKPNTCEDRIVTGFGSILIGQPIAQEYPVGTGRRAWVLTLEERGAPAHGLREHGRGRSPESAASQY